MEENIVNRPFERESMMTPSYIDEKYCTLWKRKWRKDGKRKKVCAKFKVSYWKLIIWLYLHISNDVSLFIDLKK